MTNEETVEPAGTGLSDQTESTGTQKLEDLQAELKKEKDDYLRLRLRWKGSTRW
jgi:molecular chaperone GrpE (heat shock protein)